MRILDEKGKLFGIINIFDLLILFFVVSFIFLAVKWSQVAEDPSWIRIKTFYTPCIVKAMTPKYIADIIKEGDKMVNEDGAVIARIEKIINNEPTNPPPPPPPPKEPKPDIYLSKDGEMISIKPGIIVVSSKGGEKVFRPLEPKEKPEPKTKVESKPNEEESRTMIMHIDILCYKKKGEIYSCISYQPLKIATDFTMFVHKKPYFLILKIRKVLTNEIKMAGEAVIDREL